MPAFLAEEKNRIQERLDVLKPAVDEYQTLERMMRVMEGERPAGPAQRPRRHQAPRGENKQKVLDAVAERPGVSVGELAEITGVSKPLIYNVTRSAVERGELRREELPSGAAGFRLAEGP